MSDVLIGLIILAGFVLFFLFFKVMLYLGDSHYERPKEFDREANSYYEDFEEHSRYEYQAGDIRWTYSNVAKMTVWEHIYYSFRYNHKARRGFYGLRDALMELFDNLWEALMVLLFYIIPFIVGLIFYPFTLIIGSYIKIYQAKRHVGRVSKLCVHCEYFESGYCFFNGIEAYTEFENTCGHHKKARENKVPRANRCYKCQHYNGFGICVRYEGNGIVDSGTVDPTDSCQHHEAIKIR